MQPATTPDGRYMIVRGRLWRTANPELAREVRQKLVNELMSARRAVRIALKSTDREALEQARANVQAAKEALGERGPVWWTDGAADFNRTMIENTPYAQWWERHSQGRPG